MRTFLADNWGLSRGRQSKIACLPLKTPITLYSATRRAHGNVAADCRPLSPDFFGTNLSRGESVPIHELQ